jgi:hypothetical protein
MFRPSAFLSLHVSMDRHGLRVGEYVTKSPTGLEFGAGWSGLNLESALQIKEIREMGDGEGGINFLVNMIE